jgi:hypothetical protein
MNELKFYGTVEFENKNYLLIEEAYIGNDYYSDDILKMQATALDENFKKVFVTWEFVHEENFELDDYHYSIATSVEYI